jgi:hypothetical protein
MKEHEVLRRLRIDGGSRELAYWHAVVRVQLTRYLHPGWQYVNEIVIDNLAFLAAEAVLDELRTGEREQC